METCKNKCANFPWLKGEACENALRRFKCKLCCMGFTRYKRALTCLMFEISSSTNTTNVHPVLFINPERECVKTHSFFCIGVGSWPLWEDDVKVCRSRMSATSAAFLRSKFERTKQTNIWTNRLVAAVFLGSFQCATWPQCCLWNPTFMTAFAELYSN